MTASNCLKCGDAVHGGEWHRSCYLAVLTAILVRRYDPDFNA